MSTTQMVLRRLPLDLCPKRVSACFGNAPNVAQSALPQYKVDPVSSRLATSPPSSPHVPSWLPFLYLAEPN